jgi:hypothetical protein
MSAYRILAAIFDRPLIYAPANDNDATAVIGGAA